MTGLKSSEIHWLVHSYIGVEGGYLGDFSYRTHQEFYLGYCDLHIDLDAVAGATTREKFIAVLTSSDPLSQAAILRGVARRFPAESERSRTPAAFRQLHEMARRCADGAAVAPHSPALSSEVVAHAFKDATALLETRGPVSAMDRVHTALHGYLKSSCARIGVEVPHLATTTVLFKLLRQHHPSLNDLGAQHESLIKILQGMSQVIDGVSTQRNNASLAHANDELLSRDDAFLAINAARTLIQYLDSRFLQSPRI